MSITVSYRHACNSGDLIASLAGVQHIYKTQGKKAKIYQQLNLKALYYEGAKHPVLDEDGIMVCMNEAQFKMIKPLIEAQEYVESFEVWEGQEVDVNLNKIKEGEYTTQPYGDLARWQFYVHPYLACDLSIPWLNVPYGMLDIDVKDKVIINFTSRYRNPLITYFFLKEWEDKVIFAGTKEEYEVFCKENKLNIPYLGVNNFLELAQLIDNCKFYIGNQSMCWWIADSMQKLRLLETCKQVPNCPPHGENGYDFLQQGALELYFKQFINQ